MQVVKDTVAHYVGSWNTKVASVGYGPTFTTSVLAGAGVAAGPVFIFGLRTAAEMRALVEWVRSRTDVQVYVPFADLVWHWEAATVCGAAECDPAVLDRITFSTSLPNWLHSRSNPLIEAVLAQAQVAGRNSTTALEVMGYTVHSAIKYTLSLMDAKVSPAAIMDQWYWSAAVQIHGLTLGPYSDTPCSAGAVGNCLCNRGARALSTYRLGGLVQGKPPVATYNFTSCELDYTPPPDYSLKPGYIVLIIVGVVVALLCAGVVGVLLLPNPNHKTSRSTQT